MDLKCSKSIKFSAQRINFSSCGIGVSAGIHGRRIGTRPRSACVYACGRLGDATCSDAPTSEDACQTSGP